MKSVNGTLLLCRTQTAGCLLAESTIVTHSSLVKYEYLYVALFSTR